MLTVMQASAEAGPQDLLCASESVWDETKGCSETRVFCGDSLTFESVNFSPWDHWRTAGREDRIFLTPGFDVAAGFLYELHVANMFFWHSYKSRAFVPQSSFVTRRHVHIIQFSSSDLQPLREAKRMFMGYNDVKMQNSDEFSKTLQINTLLFN